jgi:signal transduction histidine kinase
VDVLLEAHDSRVSLVIEDDGLGFEPEDATHRERGVGLLGMQERAVAVGATLDVESSPGEGTSVFLRCAMCGPGAAEP